MESSEPVRLRQLWLFRILGNAAGSRPTEIALELGTLSITGGPRAQVELHEVTGLPRLRRGFLGSSLSIPIRSGGDVALGGAGHAAARRFAEAAEAAWSREQRAWLWSWDERASRLLAALADLDRGNRYPSACLVEPILAGALALDAAVLSRLSVEAIGAEVHARFEPVRRFLRDPEGTRTRSAERVVATELARWSAFFDSIESKPLSPEQRLAVVVDEDATLVLADAGSGKTSVITPKAGYLVKAGIRAPEEILLLAFARDAAQEVRERLGARCGVDLETRTFHSLAYEVIGKVEGMKPALAPHATDEKAFTQIILDILRHLVVAGGNMVRQVVGLFAGSFDEPRTEWDFEKKRDYYAHIEASELRTLKGDLVRSHEERLIANWLYANGVD